MAEKIKSETILVKHRKRKNFLFVIGGIGIVVILIGSFLSVYTENSKAFAKKQQDSSKEALETSNAPVAKKEIKETWASSVERRLTEGNAMIAKGITASEASFREDAQRREKIQDKKFDNLKELILASQNSVEQKIGKVDARVSDVERSSKERSLRLSAEIKKVKSQKISQGAKTSGISNRMLPKLKLPKGQEGTGSLLPKRDSKTGSSSLLPKRGGDKPKEEAVKAVDPDKLEFVVEETVNKDIEKAFPLDDTNTTETPILAKQYELGLGFFSAVTLTGAYAPIFGETTEQASIPVLLEVEGDMIIANGFTESIDKCFTMGGAIGNPSSNTVDIRLTVIECILADGKHKVRGDIKGWVIGENGKPGLSGELIHKSGQYISRFILAGLLESLSSAFVQAAAPEAGQNDTTSIITSGAKSGAATGTQNAFSRLAEFYIELAEKTLPMIEAKAGRHVSVLVQGGTLYDVTEFNSLNVDSLIEDYENRKNKD